MVKLFKLFTLVGIDTPEELPPKLREDKEVVCSKVGVPLIALPLSESVTLSLIINDPLESVSVPFIVRSAVSDTETVLSDVRLYGPLVIGNSEAEVT